MHYLDVNAMIGPYYAPREGHFPTAAECLDEMDFYGIDEAFVYHAGAAEYDNAIGNHQLLECLKGQPRLHPCWVLSAPHFAPATFRRDVEDAIANGARLVRIFWGGVFSSLSCLDLDTLGGLLAELENHRMPVLFANDASATVTGAQLVQLKAVCKAFPALPVILTTPKFNTDHSLVYKTLELCDNFHLDTSSFHSDHVLEDVVRRFGVQHLVFGTNFPWFGGGQAKIALAYADLPDTDKAAIASGNLKRLTEAVR
jgi:predicted TIM-barrel fold metal-dependent hydrolase